MTIKRVSVGGTEEVLRIRQESASTIETLTSPTDPRFVQPVCEKLQVSREPTRAPIQDGIPTGIDPYADGMFHAWVGFSPARPRSNLRSASTAPLDQGDDTNTVAKLERGESRRVSHNPPVIPMPAWLETVAINEDGTDFRVRQWGEMDGVSTV